MSELTVYEVFDLALIAIGLGISIGVMFGFVLYFIIISSK